MDSERDEVSPSQLDEYAEEEGGGPIKSFLEHLEDLRWTLIKCLVTILISMLVCMIGSNYLTAILEFPLNHPLGVMAKKPNTELIPLHLGTNQVGVLPASVLGITNNTGSNRVASLNLVPSLIGSNWLLTLQPDVVPFVPSTAPRLKMFGPMAPVMVMLKLALFGGLILSAPLVILFVGQFVLPALHVHEKKILYQAVGFGAGLFILGVLFAYFVVTGVALMASVDIAVWMGFAADEWRAEDYISFVTKFLLGMGICFEIPVVILVLVKIGLLDYKKLSNFRAYAFVINLVIGAVVTPSGDPFTMLLFAAPLHLLYEISVIIAWFWARGDAKKALRETRA
ncbi:MAG: twin-arginine translocase subunit TatC [Verrucomicrobiales bacterium]|nr:twin-arginine translocase subunit TatC [Verrucomicrobiales bacterium]